MDSQSQVDRINTRLKAARTGVSIQLRKNRLFMRATLPPKPGSDKTKAHQQEIALGIYANDAGLKQAEAEAKKLGALLACREFDWSLYLKQPPKPTLKETVKTISQLVIEFEQDYFSRRQRNPKTETTFKDYKKVLRRLPKDELLTSALVRQEILRTEPDTKTRKRTCMVLNSFCKFAGLDVGFNISDFAGNYSPKSVNPKSLPSDDEIKRWHNYISNQYWKWAYGMLACYGLRNHELWHLDLESFTHEEGRILYVLDGKTKERFVYPLPPSGVKDFNLLDIYLPKVKGKTNADLGHRMTEYFGDAGLPFSPYTLRHCYARRCYESGLDIELAAKMLGNSVAICSTSYRAFWGEDVYRRRYEEALKRLKRNDG